MDRLLLMRYCGNKYNLDSILISTSNYNEVLVIIYASSINYLNGEYYYKTGKIIEKNKAID